jgi:hypothetical protein
VREESEDEREGGRMKGREREGERASLNSVRAWEVERGGKGGLGA